MIDPTADYSFEPMRAVPAVPDMQLIRPIGEGGFGQVWLGRNRIAGHLRAVKLIPLGGSAARDRAGREVTSITRLEANLRNRHPHLLMIHHVGKTDRYVFYVMDLADDVAGGPATALPAYRPATLDSHIAQGPLPADACLTAARQLLTGLAWLHQAGMIHRDVKPANCLLVDGQWKLADFGLLTEAGPQVSRLGTARYMPPDGRMDTRADVYAAGLVIYQMVTGMPVERFPQLGDRALTIAVDPILQRLVRLVLWACQPDPGQRPGDARAMLAELAALEPAASERATLTARRVWLATAATALLAAALGGLASWLSQPDSIHVNFATYPFEAQIYLDGTLQTTAAGQVLLTPCTVDDLPARPHHVVFRRPGYPDLDVGQIDFRQTRDISSRWPSP
jgi:serine/threonine-protein kinase